MKIIATDNFDRENIDERLMEEGLDSDQANKLCAEMNNFGAPINDWYVVVPDDHVLYEWSP
jgi:hypothetical protein